MFLEIVMGNMNCDGQPFFVSSSYTSTNFNTSQTHLINDFTSYDVRTHTKRKAYTSRRGYVRLPISTRFIRLHLLIHIRIPVVIICLAHP